MKWGLLMAFMGLSHVLPIGLLSAQETLPSPSLRLATRQFISPETGVFLEVQAEFMSGGLTWMSAPDSTVRAAVEWTVVAYDSTGVVAGFAKSTARTGDLPSVVDFVDVVRIPLQAGPHVLELEVKDVGSLERPHLAYETVVEVSGANDLDISDLFVVQGVAPASSPPSTLTRSGKDILPLVGQPHFCRSQARAFLR